MEFYKSDFDQPLLISLLQMFAEDIPRITKVNFFDVVKYLKNLRSDKKALMHEVFRLTKLILTPAQQQMPQVNDPLVHYVVQRCTYKARWLRKFWIM